MRAARAAGADIVGIGAVFASATKPHAPPVPHDVLARARECGMRVAAIGGITLENAPGLIASGADLLAVVSDLFDNSGYHVARGGLRRAVRLNGAFA